MAFVNLLMLVGLAGIAVPLVLHFLSRSRFRTIEWGAMMFLLPSSRRQRRTMKLKQWLLLGLRMLMIALVALALSRPRLSQGVDVGATQRVVVIVLDRSASMAVKELAHTRMESAKAAAIRILKTLGRGSELTLVLTGSAAGVETISDDLPSLARRLADMEPADGAADLPTALARAAGVAERSAAAQKSIYLITDRQKQNWNAFGAQTLAEWSRRHRVALVVVPVGGLHAANAAVTDMSVLTSPVVAGQPAEIEITVRNFGPGALADLPLTLKEDHRLLYDTSLSLAAGESATVRTSVSFSRASARLLTAAIAPDEVPQDDSRDVAVLVTPPTPVLVISGDEREGTFRRESDFLRLALMPWKSAGKNGADPVQLTITPAEQWPSLDVSTHPVTILANVPQLSESQSAELERYIYSGGGVLITSGVLVQPGVYNRRLYRGGSGILPAELAEASSRSEAPTAIIGIDTSHPLMRFAQSSPDPLPTAAISRYTRVSALRPDARVLMTLASGEALLSELALGRGRVLFLSTSIDADWTTLPLTGFYLPFAQSLVRYLASPLAPELNIAAGSPIEIFARSAPTGSVVVQRPDGRREPAVLSHSGSLAQIRYGSTDLPGRYTVVARTGADDTRWFVAATTARPESNLAALAPEELDAYARRLGAAVLEADSPSFDTAVGAVREPGELWLPLILAALAVGLVELAVARRWSRQTPTASAVGVDVTVKARKEW
jgi:hypothetical protein